MASIKGFQLKNVKEVVGREGYGCLATIYLNGKRIGSYEDYGDGGCEDVTYISAKAEEEMTKIIIDYAKTHPCQFIVNIYNERPQQFKAECENFKKYHPYIPDKDITIDTMSANSIVYIVEDFLNLLRREKLFKKYQKKGYRAISVNGEQLSAYPASWSDEKIKIAAKGKELYMSLEDFNK